MKKTVMILYSERYDTSALAIKEYLDEDGKYDVIAIGDKEHDNFRLLATYNGLYRFTYRKMPALNNVLINLPTAEAVRKKDSDGNIVLFKPNSETFQRWRKFDNISMRFDADYVICTTQYTIRKAVIAREKYKLRGKIFALFTDYALQDNFVNHDVDGYFVVTQRVKNSLIAKGIDGNKVYVIRMPLRITPPVKRTKEEIKKQFDIRNDLPVIALIGGRYGSKYLYDALISVSDVKDYNILVVIDKNHAVEKKFRRWEKKNIASSNIYFVERTSDLSKVYFIADRVFASPTAAICYETLLRRIPLLLIASANNVEYKNAKHLISSGYAYSGKSKRRVDMALEQMDGDMSAWRRVVENRIKDDGCEQFLRCLDLIDEDKDPNAEYLYRSEEPEEVATEEAVEEETAQEETKKKKKKRRFFRK